MDKLATTALKLVVRSSSYSSSVFLMMSRYMSKHSSYRSKRYRIWARSSFTFGGSGPGRPAESMVFSAFTESLSRYSA